MADNEACIMLCESLHGVIDMELPYRNPSYVFPASECPLELAIKN